MGVRLYNEHRNCGGVDGEVMHRTMSTGGLAELLHRPAPQLRKPLPSRPHTDALSPQQLRVWELAKAGLKNKEIANETGLAEGTVKVYLWRGGKRVKRQNTRRRAPGDFHRETSPCDSCLFHGLARWLQVVVKQVIEDRQEG